MHFARGVRPLVVKRQQSIRAPADRVDDSGKQLGRIEHALRVCIDHPQPAHATFVVHHGQRFAVL